MWIIITSQTILCDHHTRIVMYGLVLLKPSTMDGNRQKQLVQHSTYACSRCSGNTDYCCYTNTCNGKSLVYANPLLFKTTAASETTAHDPPPHDKTSQQVPTPTTTLLTLHYNQSGQLCPPPPFEDGGGAIITTLDHVIIILTECCHAAHFLKLVQDTFFFNSIRGTL